MSEKVFVYGTLMSGRCNHFYMEKEDVKFLGKGRANGFALYKVTPYYPGAVKEEGESVMGEVYEIPKEYMDSLDRFEENGFLYRREKAEVELESGERVTAWIYLWLRDYCSETKVPLDRQPWGGCEDFEDDFNVIKNIEHKRDC